MILSANANKKSPISLKDIKFIIFITSFSKIFDFFMEKQQIKKNVSKNYLMLFHREAIQFIIRQIIIMIRKCLSLSYPQLQSGFQFFLIILHIKQIKQMQKSFLIKDQPNFSFQAKFNTKGNQNDFNKKQSDKQKNSLFSTPQFSPQSSAREYLTMNISNNEKNNQMRTLFSFKESSVASEKEKSSNSNNIRKQTKNVHFSKEPQKKCYKCEKMHEKVGQLFILFREQYKNILLETNQLRKQNARNIREISQIVQFYQKVNSKLKKNVDLAQQESLRMKVIYQEELKSIQKVRQRMSMKQQKIKKKINGQIKEKMEKNIESTQTLPTSQRFTSSKIIYPPNNDLKCLVKSDTLQKSISFKEIQIIDKKWEQELSKMQKEESNGIDRQENNNLKRIRMRSDPRQYPDGDSRQYFFVKSQQLRQKVKKVNEGLKKARDQRDHLKSRLGNSKILRDERQQNRQDGNSYI